MPSSDVRILAVGTELPGPPIDNATLARRFNMPAQAQQWIEAFIGTRTRHFAFDLDTGEVRDSLADMGEAAGRRAMTAAGVEPGQIDLIVMGTSTPDLLLPTTASQIADRLGIDDVPTYQLQSGCTGAVQALTLAYQLLASGAHRTALVLGGDSTAKFFDINAQASALSSGEQVSGVMFGDAAGALVLGAAPDGPGPVVRRAFHRLVGLHKAPGHAMEWFGTDERDPDRPVVFEDYKAIEQAVPVLSQEVLAELLHDLDWKAAELDYLLPPQLSGVMTSRIVRQLAVPDAQEISCVDETGNTANALPFFQLERLIPRMLPGQRAAAVTIESSKWIKAGFALEKR